MEIEIIEIGENMNDDKLSIKEEVHRCRLCYDAVCKQMYPNINPERILRAIQFDNRKGARYLIDEGNPLEKNNACLEKCPLNINIDMIIQDLLKDDKISNLDDIDLSTDVCGVKLENPFLLSSSIVGSRYDMCRRALHMGWAGVVLKTISLKKIKESSPRFSALKDWDESFAGFKNIEQLSEYSLEDNLEMIRKLKMEFPNKVIIASIMGNHEEEWRYLAKKVEEAGADLIELNFSCPNMKYKDMGDEVGHNPVLVEEYTRAVRESVSIPILAKMTPNITDMRLPAIASIKGGANGIAAINTIKCITGIDLDTLVPEPQVNGMSSLGGYSGKAVRPIALRFISELTSDKELSNTSFSGMGGIYTWKDAVMFLLLGCTNIQITTAVMEYGYRIIDDLILGLKIIMKEKNYHKVSDFIGLSKSKITSNDLLDSNSVLYPKFNYDKCIGCGRCYLSCRDGGHDAIKFEQNRRPILDGSKCVGCHLCRLVCNNSAIDVSLKRQVLEK